jgi:diacylglycerol kinase
MFKNVLSRYNLLGYLMASLSIAWLFGEAINYGWVAPFTHIFKAYNIVKAAILGPLEPYIEEFVRSILTWLPQDWRLQRHWNDIFVLMSLYFSARAAAYRKAGLSGRAAFRYLFGVPLSGVVAVLAGLVITDSAISNAILAVTPIIGILVFEIVDSAVSATVAREGNLSWSTDWIRYLKFSLPILAFGLGGIALASWMFRASEAAQTNSLGLFCLLGFTVALAFYWAFRALLFALPTEHRSPGESVWARFKRSSNTEIASSMGATIGMAMLILMSNAGFEAAEAFMGR